MRRLVPDAAQAFCDEQIGVTRGIDKLVGPLGVARVRDVSSLGLEPIVEKRAIAISVLDLIRHQAHAGDARLLSRLRSVSVSWNFGLVADDPGKDVSMTRSNQAHRPRGTTMCSGPMRFEKNWVSRRKNGTPPKCSA